MIYVENLFRKAIIVLIIYVLYSCEQKVILIEGNINNLPDGIIYLSKDNYLNKIDSIRTVDGKFIFKHDLEVEPVYLALHHIDKSGIYRAISFPTEAQYNKSDYNSQFFLSDSIILINGSLTDNTPMGVFVGNTKYVTTPKITAGYQTNALFHIDGDLFDNIDKTTYNKVFNKIKEYPNSFHLLYQINYTRNSFSASQIQNLLYSFKGEITQSETFKKLEYYNNKRIDKNKLVLPQLVNDKGLKTEIIDNNYNRHLVIFWASWCGPCRQEIPALKTMHSKYKNDIEFVSISTDEKSEAWQKALVKENMAWKQLIVNENTKEYESVEIYFQLSSSIPYVALVDNNMKVIKSHVGLMSEKEMEKFIKE
jgi:thiol-disulfide isomerase/thioredoxin